MKVQSLRRLRQLLDEVQWIDDKILEVDIHIGRLYYAIDKAGFEAPPPAIDRSELRVASNGRKFAVFAPSIHLIMLFQQYILFIWKTVRLSDLT